MKQVQRLPDSEFLIMEFFWKSTPPITTSMLMESLGKERKWKIQTINTLFNRLTNRGFIRSEDIGRKSKQFYPIISRDEYLQQETQSFMSQYKIKSPLALINTLYSEESIKENELNELEDWLRQQRSRGN